MSIVKASKLILIFAIIFGLAIAAFMPRTSRAGVPAQDEEAAKLYKARCAACHGIDGRGDTPFGKRENLRDLGSPEVQAMTDEELYEVTGKGKGKMPGYEKSLGEEKVKALVAHMRTFKRQE